MPTAGEHLLRRYLWFVIGVIINAFGVALITKAALGTSPISSIPLVLDLKFGPSMGQFSFAINFMFIIAQAVLYGKQFQMIQWLQIGVNALFSVILDSSMHVLLWLQPETLWLKFTLLLLGCAVLGLGISIEVAPDALIVPGEGVVKAISIATHCRFDKVKVMFDVTSVMIAVALSLAFFWDLNGIGVGTAISALLIGRFVALFNQKLPLIRYLAGLKNVAA